MGSEYVEGLYNAEAWNIYNDGSDDDIKALAKMAEVCEQGIIEVEEKRRRLVETPGGVNTESNWAAEQRLRHQETIKVNQRLRHLGASFDRVLDRCIKRIKRVPDETLKWLASIDPTRPSSKPFGRNQEIAMTERWAGLEEVIRCLDAFVAAFKDSDPEGDDDEHDNPERDALDLAVFQYCIVSIKQKLGKERYRNPLLHFTAVLGIDRYARRGFRRTCILDFSPVSCGVDGS
ncbi:hypothetical protein V8C42DRAFT_349555 [Trichoderma barbatum]